MTGLAAQREWEDVVAGREKWFEGQLDLDPLNLVFIDETAISTDMARRCGRAPRGAGLSPSKLRIAPPQASWRAQQRNGNRAANDLSSKERGP